MERTSSSITPATSAHGLPRELPPLTSPTASEGSASAPTADEDPTKLALCWSEGLAGNAPSGVGTDCELCVALAWDVADEGVDGVREEVGVGDEVGEWLGDDVWVGVGVGDGIRLFEGLAGGLLVTRGAHSVRG